MEKKSEEGEHQKIINASGVFVVRKTEQSAEFLLARRLDSLEHGRLSPPGGREEGEEGPFRCVTRELWEETGLEITLNDLTLICEGRQSFTESEVSFYYKGFQVIWIPRMGKPKNKEPNKHGPWEWVSEYQMENLKNRGQLSAAGEFMWWTWCQYQRPVGTTADFAPLVKNIAVNRLLPDADPNQYLELLMTRLNEVQQF